MLKSLLSGTLTNKHTVHTFPKKHDDIRKVQKSSTVLEEHFPPDSLILACYFPPHSAFCAVNRNSAINSSGASTVCAPLKDP